MPTFVEQGVPAVFANWRGFFAAPGTSEEQIDRWSNQLQQLYETQDWQTIRDNRGWTDFMISGDEFVAFLEQQEREMAVLLRDLSLLE